MAGKAQKLSQVDSAIFNCASSVEDGDYVYITPSGVLDKTDSSTPLKMPAIGKVIKKFTTTTCAINDKLIDEDFSGITPNQSYFISDVDPGGLQDFPPTDPGSVIQEIGRGLSGDKILVNIDPTNIVIRT